jgi:O-antigen ligase
MSLVFQALAVGLALLTGLILTKVGGAAVLAAFGLAFLILCTFVVGETVLPILLILTMALGSAYSWKVAEQSFYLRFLVLGVIALRGAVLVLKRQSGSPEPPGGRITWLHITLPVVGGLGLLTSPYSIAPMVSIMRAISFLLMGVVILQYFWLRTDTIAKVENVATAFWWSTLVILGTGFFFLMIGWPGMFMAGRLRLVLGNPNQLGNYCALMSPIIVWFLTEKAKGRMLWPAWVLVIAMCTSLVWSGSRAGLVAAVAALLLFSVLCYRKHLTAIIFGACLIGALQVLLGDPSGLPAQDPTFFQERILRPGGLETGSGRTEIWKASRHLISKRPWFGYGFGIVDRMFDGGYFPVFTEFKGGHVHNSYLEELVNLGWVGASVIFFTLAYLLSTGVGMILRPIAELADNKLMSALFCVVFAGMISGIFESWFTSVGSVFCFPFWLAAVLFLKVRQLCASVRGS